MRKVVYVGYHEDGSVLETVSYEAKKRAEENGYRFEVRLDPTEPPKPSEK